MPASTSGFIRGDIGRRAAPVFAEMYTHSDEIYHRLAVGETVEITFWDIHASWLSVGHVAGAR